MLFKDYYAILGLQNSASLVQIKHAFYKLALKYHPDKNPLDPASCDKFKVISEANKVLSDPEKRKNYDTLYAEMKKTDCPKQGGYERYFVQKRKIYQSQATGTHTSKRENVSKKNSSFSDFMNNFSNVKFSSKVNNNSYYFNKCTPYRTFLHIPLEDTLLGAKKNLVIENIKVPVLIPPGVANGKDIIYHGFFSDNHPFLKRDLIITILINKHPIFKRYNQNLMCALEIDIYTAILGGIREIHTLDNKLLRLRIPESTNSGTLLRLKGQGLPSLSNTQLRGDLFVKINIHIPRNFCK